MEQNKNSDSSLSIKSVIKLVAFVLVVLGGGILATGLTPTIFPKQASAEARSVDQLFTVLLLLGGIVFFLIQGLLLVSVIAFRARPGDTSDGKASHGNMTLEIVWTIIPALTVAFIAIISFKVWSDNSAVKDNENIINGESIPIEVKGQQYAWSIAYLTDDVDVEGKPIIINTGNVLYTYVGQNVRLDMQAQDVIHSFWVPAMRVKQDLLPGNLNAGGRLTQLRFTPVTIEGESYPARYPIVCAELCGDGHSRMTGTVIVYESRTAFETEWYNPKVEELRVPPKDPVARGAGIITSFPCSGCHTLSSLGWTGVTGPSLEGIGARAGERGAAAGGETAEEYLVNSLWNSTEYLVPGYGPLMPKFGPEQSGAYQMSAENLYAIVAYLCTETGGGDSDCDVANNTLEVPAAIEREFGLIVDVNFGGSAVSGTSPEATPEVNVPSAESTAEATAEAESTDEPEATAEATTEAESSD